MASKNYIYRILARLAYLQAVKPVYWDDASASDLHLWLEGRIKNEEHEEFFRPESVAELKARLRDLEGIGVVQGSMAADSEVPADKDACRWRFAGSLPADSKILQRDGGDGPPATPPPGQGQGDGDGGGSGGLAQILAHPVLFALEEKDVDAALANAFGAHLKDGPE